MTNSSPRLSPTRRADARAHVDMLIVRSVKRWAVILSILLFLYDLAILSGWPFPAVLGVLRGMFYGAAGFALVLGTLIVTFLGYRFLTLRVVRQARSLFVIFLPGVILVTSIVGLLLLAAPR